MQIGYHRQHEDITLQQAEKGLHVLFAMSCVMCAIMPLAYPEVNRHGPPQHPDPDPSSTLSGH